MTQAHLQPNAASELHWLKVWRNAVANGLIELVGYWTCNNQKCLNRDLPELYNFDGFCHECGGFMSWEVE